VRAEVMSNMLEITSARTSDSLINSRQSGRKLIDCKTVEGRGRGFSSYIPDGMAELGLEDAAGALMAVRLVLAVTPPTRDHVVAVPVQILELFCEFF
jgi:hypothetical protein